MRLSRRYDDDIFYDDTATERSGLDDTTCDDQNSKLFEIGEHRFDLKLTKKVLIMILLHLNYGSFTLRKHHPRFSLRMTEYLDATIASCLKTDQFKVIQDLDLLSFGTTI